MQLFHASCQKKSRVCLHCSVILLFLTDYNDYANPLVCVFFIALTPIWILIARRIPSTREVLYSGWEPVIIAMAISRYNKEIFSHLSAFISNIGRSEKSFQSFFFSVGGLILDKTVSNPNYAGMAVFTPVINGEHQINSRHSD